MVPSRPECGGGNTLGTMAHLTQARSDGGAFEHGEAFALAQDAGDALRAYRSLFAIPKSADICAQHGSAAPRAGAAAEECVYLCGNSLGLMPRATRDAVMQELDDWARLGVEGHLGAKHPWLAYHEEVREMLARLVGAKAHEVVAMNSLTVNLHLMMASFYVPSGERTRIVIEDAAFPSDSYAVQSQAAWHGLPPGDTVVRLKARPGERTLRTEDVCGYLESAEGRKVALVLLGGVNYLTGQVMDMGAITEAGHRAGAVVGWDLAHAAGNVALRLHDWNADFACWCSYKYLNSGPGAVAGCFVHERHVRNTSWSGAGSLRRFAGWWGNEPRTRFAMGPEFEAVASADAWQLSNPPVLALAPVRESLAIFDRATMPALRAKSERLTGYLLWLVDQAPRAREVIEVITPRERGAMGSQLSLAVKTRAKEFHRSLLKSGVVCDYREPNVVRVAPTALYNSFHDCWRFSEILREHLSRGGD